MQAKPCIYREQVVIDKPLTLRGRPGSEIRGSEVWIDWEERSNLWRSEERLPEFPQTAVECMPGTDRCLWPEQVFFDGEPLLQVAHNPGPEEFAVDDDRRVVLGQDPGGHLVEVTVRRHWVLGAAEGVTITGFTMRHAANEGRSGAIMNRMKRLDGGYANWTVQNNRLSDAHGGVISLSNAPGLRILNNEIYRGGQLGIKSTGRGQIVRGNRIHHNNTEDFNWRWEAGGLKTSHAEGVRVDSNEFYANRGNAIWFDIDSSNNTISNNRIHHNSRRGIHYEISEYGKIFDNVLWENGWGTPERGLGAAISLGNSRNTEIHGNVMAWNAGGISVIGIDREGTYWDSVHGIHVHDNAILAEDYPEDPVEHFALAWIQGWSTQMFDPANDNRGENNAYWYPTPEGDATRYEWAKTAYSRLADFNATPGEENGRYLTRDEKDALVAEKGIPAAPERHGARRWSGQFR